MVLALVTCRDYCGFKGKPALLEYKSNMTAQSLVNNKHPLQEERTEWR